MLEFAKMAAPWGACLDACQKSKQYDMGDLWAKFGAFWKNLNQNIPNTPDYNPMSNECNGIHRPFNNKLKEK